MIRRNALALAAAAILCACGTMPQSDPTGFVPMRDAPPPGYTQISEFFGVEVSGSFFKARAIEFFHFAQGKKELIGAEYFPPYQSRQGAYAVSEDGRMLLFIHAEQLNTDKLQQATGLYEFVHERGARLLDAKARSGIYINDTLPMNAIVFKRKSCPDAYCMNDPVIVRGTDGAERPWEFPVKNP